MGEATYKATSADREIAFSGIRMQAERFGLDYKNKDVQQFLKHMVEVKAHDIAAIRHYTNALHESSYHPCTSILIEGLRDISNSAQAGVDRQKARDAITRWDIARRKVDSRKF